MKTTPTDSNLMGLKNLAFLALVVVLILPAVVVWLVLLSRKGVAWIAGNHEKATEATRDVARGTIVVSKIAVLWAWLVAPTGLTAAAAAIGITSTPVIVLVAPYVVAVSGATLAISAALELFSKWQKKRATRQE
jgi:ABC-type transport system involved in multi-copper enzyme maturation permease subunit